MSKRDVDVAIKNWPHIMGLSLRRLTNALDCFSEISVRRRRLVPVITSSPQLLLRKPSEFFEVRDQILPLLNSQTVTITTSIFSCRSIAFLLYQIYLFVNVVNCNKLKQTSNGYCFTIKTKERIIKTPT